MIHGFKILIVLMLVLVGWVPLVVAEERLIFADKTTGLMWQEQDNGSDISWPDAKVYCEQLQYGGFGDWRMPTQDELATIYRLEAAENSDYYIRREIKISACCQWASDTKKEKVASFDFEYGHRDWGYPMSTVDARVIAVRKIK